MNTSLQCINPNAAGIDIGSKSHFVAVPADRDEQCVRQFSFFTEDLHELCKWLKKCKITTIAIEATGSYWIPLYDVLKQYNFDVALVNGRYARNVSGRKSDVQDCQWLQQLHSYGLLSRSFIPEETARSLRQLIRHRENLVRQLTREVHVMQKTLTEMNMQLHNVISDIVGTTGIKIIRAIVEGERDPKILAQYRDGRCRNSEEVIEKSLKGIYKEESLYVLKQTLQTYDHYCAQLQDCDKQIKLKLDLMMNNEGKDDDITKQEAKLKRKRETSKNKYAFDVQEIGKNILGVDLMSLPGVNTKLVMLIISEIGSNLSSFASGANLASWLGLAPNNKISGGKVLSSRVKKNNNKLKEALKMAVQSLDRTDNFLGRFYKRLKARLGPAKAIIAAARKLVILIYDIMTKKIVYNPNYGDEIEQSRQKKIEDKLRKQAKRMGFDLVPNANESPLNAAFQNL
jgi:transposase